MTAKTKRRRPARPKKAPKIVTERPDPSDPAPLTAYRYGCTVLVRSTGEMPAVLTANEARVLAAILILQADLAERTPTTGPQGCRQLPDE